MNKKSLEDLYYGISFGSNFVHYLAVIFERDKITDIKYFTIILPKPCLLFHAISSFQYFIITDSVVLWKIQKFDWLIPETK